MMSRYRRMPFQMQTEWPHRLVAALFYAAFYFVIPTIFNLPFLMFLILGIFYWAAIHHRRIPTTYFIRYHLLQALLGFLFICLSGSLYLAVAQVLVSGLDIFGLGDIFLILLSSPFLSAAHLLIMIAVIGYSATMCLLGKMHKLPLVSDMVDRWV